MICPRCTKPMVYTNQDYVSHEWRCRCGHWEKCDFPCCNKAAQIKEVIAKWVESRLSDLQIRVNHDGGPTAKMLIEELAEGIRKLEIKK